MIMSNGLEAGKNRRKVTLEICPEDVLEIQPFNASDRVAPKYLKRRSRLKSSDNGVPKKKKLKKIDENGECSDWSSSSEDFEPIEKNELFGDGDVEGKTLFPLSTPKKTTPLRSASDRKRSSSAVKACTPKNKTPRSLKKSTTPSRSDRKRKLEFPQTEKQTVTPPPSQVSNPNKRCSARIKKQIQYAIAADQMGSDDSGSEYSGDSDETDDESSSECSDASSADEKQSPTYRRKSIIPLSVAPVRKTAKREVKYVCSAKDYFHSKSLKKKDKTSNNILSQLQNPSLSHNQFKNILKKITQSHNKEINLIKDNLCYQFDKWMFLLSQNFSVILYGLGSKKDILETFRKRMLNESKVLVVNGFFPSITLKEILDSISKELLSIKESAPNTSYAVDLIKNRLDNYKSAPHIFLIINNIDGPCLRDEKCQNALSLLASHKKIHLVASVDHVNAPLIWDVAKLGNLSPAWIDATTFLPYIHEVSFENSFLIKHSGSTMALASLINVYKSLTSNAKKVYCILVEDHLANIKNKNYRGMTFIKLYNAAKRDFIVSSDLSLRTLLTEFFDHQLAKDRKDSEHITIPLETSVLMKFMDLRNESSI